MPLNLESQFLEVKVKDSWLDLKGLANHNQRPIKTLPAQKEAPHWMTHKIRSCASHSVILIDWCWLKIVIFIVICLFLFVYLYVCECKSTLDATSKKYTYTCIWIFWNHVNCMLCVHVWYLFKMIFTILKWKPKIIFNRRVEKYETILKQSCL